MSDLTKQEQQILTVNHFNNAVSNIRLIYDIINKFHKDEKDLKIGFKATLKDLLRGYDTSYDLPKNIDREREAELRMEANKKHLSLLFDDNPLLLKEICDTYNQKLDELKRRTGILEDITLRYFESYSKRHPFYYDRNEILVNPFIKLYEYKEDIYSKIELHKLNSSDDIYHFLMDNNFKTNDPVVITTPELIYQKFIDKVEKDNIFKNPCQQDGSKIDFNTPIVINGFQLYKSSIYSVRDFEDSVNTPMTYKDLFSLGQDRLNRDVLLFIKDHEGYIENVEELKTSINLFKDKSGNIFKEIDKDEIYKDIRFLSHYFKDDFSNEIRFEFAKEELMGLKGNTLLKYYQKEDNLLDTINIFIDKKNNDPENYKRAISELSRHKNIFNIRTDSFMENEHYKEISDQIENNTVYISLNKITNKDEKFQEKFKLLWTDDFQVFKEDIKSFDSKMNLLIDLLKKYTKNSEQDDVFNVLENVKNFRISEYHITYQDQIDKIIKGFDKQEVSMFERLFTELYVNIQYLDLYAQLIKDNKHPDITTTRDEFKSFISNYAALKSLDDSFLEKMPNNDDYQEIRKYLIPKLDNIRDFIVNNAHNDYQRVSDPSYVRFNNEKHMLHVNTLIYHKEKIDDKAINNIVDNELFFYAYNTILTSGNTFTKKQEILNSVKEHIDNIASIMMNVNDKKPLLQGALYGMLDFTIANNVMQKKMEFPSSYRKIFKQFDDINIQPDEKTILFDESYISIIDKIMDEDEIKLPETARKYIMKIKEGFYNSIIEEKTKPTEKYDPSVDLDGLI